MIPVGPRKKQRNKRKLSKAEIVVRDWVNERRGILSSIARDAGVSPQFVQRIVYGRSDSGSRDRRVETALEKLGWQDPKKSGSIR